MQPNEVALSTDYEQEVQERRRSSNQEENGDEDDNEQQDHDHDHHESEDEETIREATLGAQDDHENDEFVPTTVTSSISPSSVSTSHANTSHRNVSNYDLRSISPALNPNNRHIVSVSNGASVMSSLNVNTRGHNQGGAGRFSPDPIDPIDIDYDPSASAHDLEIQGDHDADGDHFPNSPGASSSRGTYDGGPSRTNESSYRLSRGSSHQHEHFEMASIPTTSYASGDSGSVSYAPHSYSSHQAFVMDETTEHLSAAANVVAGERRGIPCDQSEERQDVRTEMVPVSTANSLTARDSQHLHSYGDDRDANSPVAEVVDVFRSTRQQYTPPAERSVEFADPDLTSDHEEFDSTFIAQPPPSLLLANSAVVGGATQMDVFIQTSSSSNAPESRLSSAGVSSIAGSSNVDLMRHHATTGGTASECSPGDRDGYTSHDEAPWLVDQHTDHVPITFAQHRNSLSSGHHPTSSSRSVASWDLIRFPRSFYEAADKEDDMLHREGGFSYCLPHHPHQMSASQLFPSAVHRPTPSSSSAASSSNTANQSSSADVMTGQQRTSSAASHNIDSCFLFDPNEVEAQLENQLGASACGPTAVVNVLRIMGYQVKPYFVARRVDFRQRDSLAPLPEYLMSRSVAGSTHEDLIRGIENVTQGEVSGRFFSFHPPREVCLRHWLIYWMKKGCVPVLTLNYQKKHPEANPNVVTSDSWHHQAIIGVQNSTVFLTNVAEQVHVASIAFYLCSESKLLVHWRDIWSRFDEDASLQTLAQQPHQDPRWTDFNVLGQVCSLLRMKKRIDKATSIESGHFNTMGNENLDTSDVALDGGVQSENALSGNQVNNQSNRRSNSYPSGVLRDIGNTGNESNTAPSLANNIHQNGGSGSVSVRDQTSLCNTLLPSHIVIPSIVQAGVTMFCRTGATSTFQELLQCDELEISADCFSQHNF